MKIKFIQVNCREEINTPHWDGPDYRRAQYVLKYKPDIIIFESANDNKDPSTVFNKYSCESKPVKLVHAYIKNLRKEAGVPGNGDAASDIPLWENILKLWGKSHNVLLYNVDGSTELRGEFFEVWKYMYPCATKNWLWWVHIYLREKYMVRDIEYVLNQHKNKEKLTVAIFLESFHWEHVKFLLKKPSKKQIWEYYFKRFKEVTRKNIGKKIHDNNKVFYKYWERISDFA
jgi:hypothetical protein